MSKQVLAAGAAVMAVGGSLQPAAAQQTASTSGPAAGPADTVVVLGLRSGQPADQSGTALSIVSSDDIDRRALTFGVDAIASMPGVAVSQAGAWGGVASVRIRGSGPGQTLVLIDGVPVSDVASPGGAYDFGGLELFGVERIEVLRGPQSTLWGGDAIGGVVSIVTQDAPVGMSWRGFGEAGSFETLRAGASLAGGTERARGRLAGRWTASEGISKADTRNGNPETDGYESASLSGRGRLSMGEGLALDTSFRWAVSDLDFDGFPPPAFALADTSERQTSDESSGRLTLTADAFGDRYRGVLEATASAIRRETFLGDISTTRNEGERWGLRYTGQVQMAPAQDLLFGIEHEETRADGQAADANAVFALYSAELVDGVSFSGGLRQDEDGRHGRETTGRATLSWQARDWLRLRSSWGQGFKPPTIFQTTFICTFCGLTTPSRDLKAETSEAVDLGADVRVGALEASLTWFDQDSRNLISFDFARGYANIAEASQTGVEVTAEAPLGRWLEARGAYTHLDAEDGQGAPLPRVPEHSGSLELVLGPREPFTVSVSVRHNGRQSDGFGPDVKSWTRADLAATYRFASGVDFYARIENLADRPYQQVGGYGTPGLSGIIGIRVGG